MLVILVRRRDVALLPVGAVMLVFVLQPYAWWARFTLPLAALGAVAIALAASGANTALLARRLPYADNRTTALLGASVDLLERPFDELLELG